MQWGEFTGTAEQRKSIIVGAPTWFTFWLFGCALIRGAKGRVENYRLYQGVDPGEQSWTGGCPVCGPTTLWGPNRYQDESNLPGWMAWDFHSKYRRVDDWMWGGWTPSTLQGLLVVDKDNFEEAGPRQAG